MKNQECKTGTSQTTVCSEEPEKFLENQLKPSISQRNNGFYTETLQILVPILSAYIWTFSEGVASLRVSLKVTPKKNPLKVVKNTFYFI